MAAAEARAVWQRTANRCFVQEDAKRAPKLACCPSASPSLSKQSDTRPANVTDRHDNFTTAFPLLNHDSSYSNLSSDSRWWLQFQPDYIYQRGLTKEEVNHENGSVKQDQTTLDFMDSQSILKFDNGGEDSYEFVDMGSVDCSGFKEINEFSLDSNFPHWMGSEKGRELPWWRMTDKDDLASFVSHRSNEFIENCDLPRPLNMSFNRDPYAHDECLDSFESCFKPQRVKCQNVAAIHTRWNSVSRVDVQSVTSNPISSLGTDSFDSTIHKISRETPMPKTDPSKAKLLEALRHSQTRARQAENAAKEAYAEKEHLVKLIFKQASQLFAYKQWLYLLQLENLYHQIKNDKTHPISSILPLSPWGVPHKTRKTLPNWPKKKPPRPKQSIPRYECDIGKYAVVFALGLGLVGAGLLLGWTVGWMLI